MFGSKSPVACFLPELCRFLGEYDWGICLWQEEQRQDEGKCALDCVNGCSKLGPILPFSNSP